MLKLEVTNLSDVLKSIRDVSPRMQRDAVKPGLRRASRIVLGEQKRLLAAEIARTQNSRSKGAVQAAMRAVTLRERKGDAWCAVLVGIVKKSAPQLAATIAQKKNESYWRDLEYGHREKNGTRVAPRPFIGPSARNKQAAIEQEVTQSISDFNRKGGAK